MLTKVLFGHVSGERCEFCFFQTSSNLLCYKSDMERSMEVVVQSKSPCLTLMGTTKQDLNLKKQVQRLLKPCPSQAERVMSSRKLRVPLPCQCVVQDMATIIMAFQDLQTLRKSLAKVCAACLAGAYRAARRCDYQRRRKMQGRFAITWTCYEV